MQTGFQDLDSMTGGFSPGELIILSGESGVGRTALALNTALYAAQHGEAAAIFSYETTTERVKQRLTSTLTSVPLRAVQSGNFRKQDWPKLFRSAHSSIWLRLQLSIFGSTNLTVGQLRATVQQISMERERYGESPVSLVVADPLRLMGPAMFATEDERCRHHATIVKQLKRMAWDLGVKVLLVCNLERDFETQGGKFPELSDLAMPDVAERYADTVLLLRRNAHPGLGSNNKGTAEMVVVKARKGFTGKIQLVWDGDCGSFRSLPDRSASTNS